MRNICFREGERLGLLGDSSSWGMGDERVVGSSSEEGHTALGREVS